MELLTTVFGVTEISQFISFEDQVHLDHTSFIDGYIEKTHVMIEQKSINKSLTAAIRQSDGSMLTPFEQAKRYSSELPYSKRPRWIVTSNFQSFYIYDMEKPGGDPEIIQLENLEKEYYRLQFLVDEGNTNLQREMEVSIAAGEIVGLLYDALAKQYVDPTTERAMKSQNILCVRMVFCLYAEDAGIFGQHGMFHDYLEEFDARKMRKAMIELFQILDTKPEDRDPYLKDDIEPFNVIYQTAKDGMGDTIKPRLVEAGADLSRVMVIDDTEEALTLSDDRIEKAVRQNHVRLVIIDPVQAFIGADVDMNRANEVRPVFRKLGMIAEKTGCAIVLIGHLNKSSGTQSTYRGLGSIDIMAAVRSLIFIGKVRKDPTTRVLIHEKSSLAPPGETMAFKLGDEEGFRWVGAYEISVDELLDGKEGKATETKLERGAKLIRELLADKKEISIRALDEKAKEQGISGRTMRDVRSRMKNELEYQVNEKQENSIRLKE